MVLFLLCCCRAGIGAGGNGQCKWYCAERIGRTFAGVSVVAKNNETGLSKARKQMRPVFSI